MYHSLVSHGKPNILCYFQIPIFEKGYEKDPAVVAREAIQEATRNNSDVVLVDTAGRMQVLIHLITAFNLIFLFWHLCFIANLNLINK